MGPLPPIAYTITDRLISRQRTSAHRASHTIAFAPLCFSETLAGDRCRLLPVGTLGSSSCPIAQNTHHAALDVCTLLAYHALSACPEVHMNSATAFRILILVIPVVWVVIRLLPAEHPRYGNLRAIASQAQEEQSHHTEQGTTGRDKVTSDKFASLESSFKAHYQSHFATSGYDYNHYRLAYKYGFDLTLDPDNQKMDWTSVEPQARQNWDEGIVGLWSQHRQAVLHGWEQGLKVNGG
jgi:hypothetical protein